MAKTKKQKEIPDDIKKSVKLLFKCLKELNK